MQTAKINEDQQVASPVPLSSDAESTQSKSDQQECMKDIKDTGAFNTDSSFNSDSKPFYKKSDPHQVI